GVTGLRAVEPVPRGRRGPLHQAAVHEHAVRAGGRRDVRGGAAGLRRRARARVGDGVAVQGRRQRGRRHGRERAAIQPEPAHAAGERRGHAAAAQAPPRGLPLRALQRGHEARPRLREELRTLPAGHEHGLQRRTLPARHHVGRLPLPRHVASSQDHGCWEGLCRPMPRRRICGHPAYHPTRIAPPVTAKSARPPTARPAEWPGFCGPKASKTKGETHRSNP
ncbi:hypothetical protein ACJX0J_037173, partial [Zea mays]